MRNPLEPWLRKNAEERKLREEEQGCLCGRFLLDREAFLRNGPILLCRDSQDANRGIGRGEVFVRFNGRIPVAVDFDTQES